MCDLEWPQTGKTCQLTCQLHYVYVYVSHVWTHLKRTEGKEKLSTKPGSNRMLSKFPLSNFSKKWIADLGLPPALQSLHYPLSSSPLDLLALTGTALVALAFVLMSLPHFGASLLPLQFWLPLHLTPNYFLYNVSKLFFILLPKITYLSRDQRQRDDAPCCFYLCSKWT